MTNKISIKHQTIFAYLFTFTGAAIIAAICFAYAPFAYIWTGGLTLGALILARLGGDRF